MKISPNHSHFSVWMSTLFSIFLVLNLSAQTNEVGVTLGATAYYGDIEVKMASLLKQTRPIAGVFYRYHASDRWAFRGQLLLGQIHADEKRYAIPSPDNFRERRGISFTTTLVELSVLPEWRFARLGNVDLYVFSGITGFHFNPNVNYNEPNPVIGDRILDKEAVYSKFSWAIPAGGGLQWFVSDKTAIGLEATIRKTFADQLDGLSLSANPKVKDYYFFANLTVSMFFDSRQRNGLGRRDKNMGCPTF